jgi:hypothetical protein
LHYRRLSFEILLSRIGRIGRVFPSKDDFIISFYYHRQEITTPYRGITPSAPVKRKIPSLACKKLFFNSGCSPGRVDVPVVFIGVV